jgi:3-oxoacyl-[acyl-carrier protein] reductase
MEAGLWTGKAAIITGAGQGIGFEIARQLCRNGAGTLLNDKDHALAEQASNQIRSEGGNCIPFAGDAGNYQFIQSMADASLNNFGRLDIAIANAGITHYGDFFSFSPESLQQVMQLNLAGSFFLAQAAAIRMKSNPEGGSILLMSSVTGVQAHGNLAAYSMTKAGLQMLAKNLVIELSPWKITINAIAPGATLTERTVSTDQGYERTWSAITPMGRPATTDDIAKAALFLVSPQARHITGQTLVVDGGWTAVSPSPGESHFREVGVKHD